MFKAEFELEAITPIFMRGADQTKAEIRASSVKGLMRWWFRALAGNYFGNDVVGLKRAEERIFGSTKKRSRVVVEVDTSKDPEPIIAEYYVNYNKKKNMLQPKLKSKSIKVKCVPTTFDLPSYLFFSIKMLIDDVAKSCLERVLSKHGIRNRFNNEDQMKSILRRRGIDFPDKLNKEFQKEFAHNILTYYPSGTKFYLKVKAVDESSFKVALASLWALVTLGGIGFRSRRGAGSVRFCGVDLGEFDNLGLRTKFRSNDELRESIKRAIKLVGEELGKSKLDLNGVNYPVLSQSTSVVALWDPGTGNPIQALTNFQRRFQKFRHEEINKPERVVFGLPMKLGEKGVEIIRYALPKIKGERRASPLMIGLIHVGGKLFVRVVKFKTDVFYPDSDMDELADWSVIGRFDEYLGDIVVFGSLEVFS